MTEEEHWIYLLKEGEPVIAGSKICGLTGQGRAGLITRLQAIVDRRRPQPTVVADTRNGENVRGRWSYD